MTGLILRTLEEIEETFGIKILHACESGSRAWGFDSKDSDYDVRFIYVSNINDYLLLNNKRDVIDRHDFAQKGYAPPHELIDVSGWDIKKALLLFRKSNPPLLEHLRSPFVYLNREGLAKNLADLSKDYWNQYAGFYHYYKMAKNNFREYLKYGDIVWQKKYLYVIRALMAVKFIEAGLGVPPVRFMDLLTMLDMEAPVGDKFYTDVTDLYQAKKYGSELGKGPKINSIHNFIESEFKRLEKKDITFQTPTTDIKTLDKLFQDMVYIQG